MNKKKVVTIPKFSIFIGILCLILGGSFVYWFYVEYFTDKSDTNKFNMADIEKVIMDSTGIDYDIIEFMDPNNTIEDGYWVEVVNTDVPEFPVSYYCVEEDWTSDYQTQINYLLSVLERNEKCIYKAKEIKEILEYNLEQKFNVYVNLHDEGYIVYVQAKKEQESIYYQTELKNYFGEDNWYECTMFLTEEELMLETMTTLCGMSYTAEGFPKDKGYGYCPGNFGPFNQYTPFEYIEVFNLKR